MNKIMKFRYWLIEKVVGDLHVCMNMKISRPNGFKGNLFFQKAGDYGVFSKNYLHAEESENLVEPWRRLETK